MIIVAHEQHCPGIQSIGKQNIGIQLLVKGVVFRDVTKQKPFGELIRRKCSKDLHIENFRTRHGIIEMAKIKTQIRLQSRKRTDTGKDPAVP